MKASVSLRPEITSSDVARLRQWTDDEAVMEYLNETQTISAELDALLRMDNIPDYTPLFNRAGRFFMIDAPDGRPVGFVRLVRRSHETEIVLAVGDRRQWGNGLGTAAIGQSLLMAFLHWRVEKVVACIHPGNLRSRRAFQHQGFFESAPLRQTVRYELTLDDYLRQQHRQQAQQAV